jgi:ribosomal protein L14
VVKVAVKSARPQGCEKAKVRAVVVRVKRAPKKMVPVRFDDNAVVLLDGTTNSRELVFSARSLGT